MLLLTAPPLPEDSVYNHEFKILQGTLQAADKSTPVDTPTYTQSPSLLFPTFHTKISIGAAKGNEREQSACDTDTKASPVTNNCTTYWEPLPAGPSQPRCRVERKLEIYCTDRERLMQKSGLYNYLHRFHTLYTRHPSSLGYDASKQTKLLEVTLGQQRVLMNTEILTAHFYYSRDINFPAFLLLPLPSPKAIR